MTPRLIYALHSGQLYGTERMSLATAAGLAADFDPVILAPPGPVHDEAARLGLAAAAFHGVRDLARAARPFFREGRDVACAATSVTQSITFCTLAAIERARATHTHIVHGGADERQSYGRKRWLLPTPVQFVAVSDFVRERLDANGVPRSRVTVIENFLSAAAVQAAPRRPPFDRDGIARIAVVSRVDPIKRVDLLLDAFDACASLSPLHVDVYGTGWDLESLRDRADRHPSIVFHGFVPDVPARLARADLLLHLCPREPFGLAILEAAAAQVPALVPASGGAGAIVIPGVTGFTFTPNDVESLASGLTRLRTTPAAVLARVAGAARGTLDSRFCAAARIADYAALLRGRARREAA